jgi:hypothetical protein
MCCNVLCEVIEELGNARVLLIWVKLVTENTARSRFRDFLTATQTARPRASP